MTSYTGYDLESGTENAQLFESRKLDTAERHIRQGFIQKVYGLLGCQLLVTTLGAAPFMLMKPQAEYFVAHNQWLIWLSLALQFGILFGLMCFPQVMKKYPQNYIVLGVFTLIQTLLVGVIILAYPPFLVLTALGMTVALVLALSLFACQTKYDFTGFGPYLFVYGMCLMGFGLLLFFFQSRMMHLVYTVLCVALFATYLIFDTQLIVGGKHRRSQEMSIDDYCFAALMLYVDIIQLFLQILDLLGQADR
eukprot:Platyproteum_vivax@DN3868_c0_g1_i2.p1